ncbi:MAG TPA: porin [Burkholderiales bacterium]|nr:porin [Burkholderiales bacterium]
MMSLPGGAWADDVVKRLLDLQLKKGIITQEEYDEFMAVTREEAGAKPEAARQPEAATTVAPPAAAATAPPAGKEPAVQAGSQTAPADNAAAVPAAAAPQKTQAATPAATADTGPIKAASTGTDGVTVLKGDSFKVEVFGTIDLSVGYTSHSLVQSGEMPTSIGPWISGGVKYPRTVPVGPGGTQVPYPASNMSSQTGLFNSALSTSSWGIKANKDIGDSGFKAFVVLDSAFNPATGQFTDQSHNESVNSKYPTTAFATSSLDGQLFAKEAAAGFSSAKWGKLGFGRNTNPMLDVLNNYAPNQKAGLYSPYGNGVYGGGGGISENARVDYSIKYQNRIGGLNVSLLYGLGGTGGLKRGAQGFAGNIGYETDRFGVQVVYEQFTDLLKTSTDAAVSNVINLTAYDQTAVALETKFKLTDGLHAQLGAQRARLSEPTPDPNIPYISNLYGEDVNKSTAYAGEANLLYISHVGLDYDLTEKINTSFGYVWVNLPKYDYGKITAGKFPNHYLGGDLDAWSGLVTYGWSKGVTIYGGVLFTHYRGPAFDDTATTIYVHDIFTAGSGFRLKF